jgi:hypothetical protein
MEVLFCVFFPRRNGSESGYARRPCDITFGLQMAAVHVVLNAAAVSAAACGTCARRQANYVPAVLALTIGRGRRSLTNCHAFTASSSHVLVSSRV